MKKLLVLLTMLLCVSLFAEETVLFKSDVSVNLDGFEWVPNFTITSDSGWFTKKRLEIKEPSEKGLPCSAKEVPLDRPCNYKIIPAYPSFLNEPNIGAGYIENIATIKYVKVIATFNRPYDTISILYSTSVNGPVKEIKMPQDFNAVKTMEEVELVFENPLYEPDVKKREVMACPILGGDIEGLYLKGIKVTTNPPSKFSYYSPYSIVYLKQISVIYDKLFTDEQLAEKKILKDEFGIDEKSEARNKAVVETKEKERLRNMQETLMDHDNSEAK